MSPTEPTGRPDEDHLRDRVARELAQRFEGNGPIHVGFGPGRVNLIGDHTDYNEGFVLPMTLGLGIYMAVRPREDSRVRLHSLDFHEDATFLLEAPPGRGTSWTHYVGGVVDQLSGRGLLPAGFDAVLMGNVPLGSGLSSSAALEVATVMAAQAAHGFELDGVEAARLCQRVEHEYIGVQCGIMDQFVSRLGKADQALFLDCRSLDYESVPISLGERVLVVMDSRKERSLAASKYNERRGECEAGVALIAREFPQVRSLRDVTADIWSATSTGLPEVIRSRCRHVVSENERVRHAAQALKSGQLEAFGALMSLSHVSLRDDYAVSCAELDLLVDVARRTEGVHGARMTGAGFGGCAVALVEATGVDLLTERLEGAYVAAFGRRPGVYVVEQNLEATWVTP